jgi:hypothetical protein
LPHPDRCVIWLLCLQEATPEAITGAIGIHFGRLSPRVDLDEIAAISRGLLSKKAYSSRVSRMLYFAATLELLAISIARRSSSFAMMA